VKTRGSMRYSLILCILVAVTACTEEKPAAKEAASLPESVVFSSASLYPEGVDWDAPNKRFLVTSIHTGVVGSVTPDGKYSVFAQDPKMVSAVGIRIDAARDRVLVCNSDPGASKFSSKDTTGKLAALAAFQLSTGKLLKYVELTQDKKDGHFCNDIAIDKDGTAYITDSFSPQIYKVDPNYAVSVLINDKAFSGNSFNLNGIVIKDNFLIVAKMNSGQLFKIPLDDPKSFSEVALKDKLEGADGLLWADDGSLIVIANNNAHVGIPASAATNASIKLTSSDGWKTASVVGKSPTGDVFATTGVLVNGRPYAIYAMLHVLFNPKTEKHLDQFTIKQQKL
jgi:sugar lactone lactonase YvrE